MDAVDGFGFFFGQALVVQEGAAEDFEFGTGANDLRTVAMMVLTIHDMLVSRGHLLPRGLFGFCRS